MGLSVTKGPDHWQKFKSNGQRVCSYCGSLHPEDMFALVKQSAEAPADGDYRKTVIIEPSDKKYKVYVHQPDVRNAGEGGIKFYMQHLPRKNGQIDVSDERQEEYAEAYAAPAGFEKVVCRTVMEAERWSGRLRQWEAAKEEIAQAYQRHQEDIKFKEVLKDIDDKIANARNNINRDFMIQARANAVKHYEDRFAWKRESYLHSEAYSADDKSVKETKARLPKKLHVGVEDMDE
ncbi:unnamed protein product [Sphagnum jensenii]